MVLPRRWPETAAPCISLRNKNPTRQAGAIAQWSPGVFEGIGRSTPMLEEMWAWQPPTAGGRPVPIGSRSIAVSLNRLFLGGLLPSRARFRFAGHRQ